MPKGLRQYEGQGMAMESRMTDGLFWGFSKLGLEPPRRKCLASRYSDASSFASRLQVCYSAAMLPKSVRVAIEALPQITMLVLSFCHTWECHRGLTASIVCCATLPIAA